MKELSMNFASGDRDKREYGGWDDAKERVISAEPVPKVSSRNQILELV